MNEPDKDSKGKLPWGVRKMWIRRIWNHRQAVKQDPLKYIHTPLWDCIKGTITLFFNWEYVGEPLYQDNAIAWGDYYRYGEYGIGEGWTELQVIGWRFNLVDDGDY